MHGSRRLRLRNDTLDKGRYQFNEKATNFHFVVYVFTVL